MYQDTPNDEYLDPPLEKLKELYSYERLKDMDLDSLHNKECELENKFRRIRAEFPPQESAMQGGFRKFVIGDSKRALTPKEKKRINLTKQELRDNIQRARAYRKDKKREHHRSVAKLYAEVLKQCAKILENLRKLYPW